MKAVTKKGEKVFINICHTGDVPFPKGLTIPMSIGHQKEVLDNSKFVFLSSTITEIAIYYCLL